MNYKGVTSLFKDANFELIRSLLEISYITKETVTASLHHIYVSWSVEEINFVPGVVDLVIDLGSFENDNELVNFLFDILITETKLAPEIYSSYLSKLIDFDSVTESKNFCMCNFQYIHVLYRKKWNQNNK